MKRILDWLILWEGLKLLLMGLDWINGSTFETFETVLASFQVEDKLGRARFFQETFLLANISVKVVLGMPYLTLSNVDIYFAEKDFTWRSYTATEALSIIKRVELIDKKEFAKEVLDKNVRAFVVHVTLISLSKPMMSIQPARKTQIALLIAKKVTIPDEYSDFSNVFSKEKALVLLEIPN